MSDVTSQMHFAIFGLKEPRKKNKYFRDGHRCIQVYFIMCNLSMCALSKEII